MIYILVFEKKEEKRVINHINTQQKYFDIGTRTFNWKLIGNLLPHLR